MKLLYDISSSFSQHNSDSTVCALQTVADCESWGQSICLKHQWLHLSFSFPGKNVLLFNAVRCIRYNLTSNPTAMEVTLTTHYQKYFNNISTSSLCYNYFPLIIWDAIFPIHADSCNPFWFSWEVIAQFEKVEINQVLLWSVIKMFNSVWYDYW